MNGNRYKGKCGGKIIFFLPLFLVAIAAFTFAVMFLWNWLMPEIFNLKEITFWQAGGLLILSKILFGGFGRGGGGKWKHHKKMNDQQFMNLSEEEREKLKQEWQQRCKK